MQTVALLLVVFVIARLRDAQSNVVSGALHGLHDERPCARIAKETLALSWEKRCAAFLHGPNLCGGCLRRAKGNCARQRFSYGKQLSMVRNVDLPECVVFYGLDTVLADPLQGMPSLQAGVMRLLKECQEVDVTRTILLLEQPDLAVFAGKDDPLTVLGGTPLQPFLQDGLLTLRSCEDVLTPPPPAQTAAAADGAPTENQDYLYDAGEMYNLGLDGQSPSPAFLLDALRSISVVPAKYASGGSAGITGGAYAFNVDPQRPPLPVHTVVIVGRTAATRERCTAARLAGTRVVHVEGPEGEDSDVEGFADAIVSTLGNDDDWEIVTLDDLSTPGSFWINPPFPRNDIGNRVDEYSVITKMQKSKMAKDGKTPENGQEASEAEEELSDSEMARILADLDPL